MHQCTYRNWYHQTMWYINAAPRLNWTELDWIVIPVATTSHNKQGCSHISKYLRRALATEANSIIHCWIYAQIQTNYAYQINDGAVPVCLHFKHIHIGQMQHFDWFPWNNPAWIDLPQYKVSINFESVALLGMSLGKRSVTYNHQPSHHLTTQSRRSGCWTKRY